MPYYYYGFDWTYLVLVLPCMLYYLLKGRRLSSPMFLTAPSLRHIGLTLSGALVLVIGSLLIKFFYRAASEQSVDISGFFDRFSAGEADPPFAGVLLSIVIIPAVCEELFFRGVVLAEYRTLGEGNAIILSAVCFAMLHFSVSGFPIYLFIGCKRWEMPIFTQSYQNIVLREFKPINSRCQLRV